MSDILHRFSAALRDNAPIRFPASAFAEGGRSLIDSRIFIPDGVCPVVECPCGAGHVVKVQTESIGKGSLVYSATCSYSHEYNELERDEIQQFIFDEACFTHLLAEKMDCPPSGVALESGLWRLGRAVFDSGSRTVYYTANPSITNCSNVKTSATAVLISGCGLLPDDAKLAERTVLLPDVLTITADGVRLDIAKLDIVLPVAETRKQTADKSQKKDARFTRWKECLNEYVELLKNTSGMDFRPPDFNYVDAWFKKHYPKGGLTNSRMFYRDIEELSKSDMGFYLYWRGCENASFIMNFSRTRFNALVKRLTTPQAVEDFLAQTDRQIDSKGRYNKREVVVKEDVANEG